MSAERKLQIIKRMDQLQGHTAFYYKNLITGEQYGCREEDIFTSASIIKLPIMLQILKWAAEGRADLTETIRIRQEDKVPISGALTLFTGEPEVDVETLIRLMISVSDNTAANVLMGRYGVEELDCGFEEMGLRKTHVTRPFFDRSGMSRGLRNVMCPREMGLLLEQLYWEKFISPKVSKMAMDILLLQQFNSKINGFLTERVPVAHKTGEDDDISHDVGIIFAAQPFILCFAGNEVDPGIYDTLMREVSHDLYLEANLGGK